MCAEGARSAWAGHLDAPEGVKRVPPGWVHLVGGMVGGMGPAYSPGPGRASAAPTGRAAATPIRGGSRTRCSVIHVTRCYLARARVYFSPPFLYPFFTLSLYLYKKEGSS